MVLGEVAAFSAAGAHAIFGYNRENFMYDRKQRQEMEFKLLEWRATQAELWRDDVREVIGLTEKKMDTYLIVNTLQLGMCVGLFAEGRLEPGTPPWLLHLYMLTLGAAFMYLLMSVWLAMHASVVASCSSVRLLTQFVRLPVPTWEQIEHMRTYAQSFEHLDPSSLLRVPFTGRRAPPAAGSSSSSSSGGALGGSSAGLAALGGAGGKTSEGAASSSQGEGTRDKVDPWSLEDHGDLRNFYELQEQPAVLRRHIHLAQRAAKHYQCFDAFARVGMSLGTNQFLNALSYYVLGYAAVQDGAPFPAFCVVVLMVAIAVGLVLLDFSLTSKEQHLAKILVVTGPMTSALTTFVWTVRGREAETITVALLPVAYAAHGAWLLFALVTCGLELQPNGSVLPMRFRAVLYLDVFGWLPKQQAQRQKTGSQESPVLDPLPRQPAASSDKLRASVDSAQAATCVPSDGATPLTNFGLDSEDRPLARVPEASPTATSPRTTEPLLGKPAVGPAEVPSGEHKEAPEHAFHPTSFLPGTSHHPAHEEGVEIVTGHDKMHPGRLPAKVFRLATMLLIILWAVGLFLPFGVFRDFMTKPLTKDIFVEDITGDEAKEEPAPTIEEVRVNARQDKVPEYHHSRPKPSLMLPQWRQQPTMKEDVPVLSEGEVLQVGWPSHSGFVPRSLSCDPTGTLLVVADDLGVYSGRLSWEVAKEAEPTTTRAAVASAARTLLEGPEIGVGGLRVPRQVLGVVFQHLSPCTALEGQALKDIGVVCTEGPNKPTCRVVVLHARGRRLAQCPLPLAADAAVEDSKRDAPGEAFKSLVTWTISSDWLHSSEKKAAHEKVESFAVNSECLESGDAAPSGEVGCVVVGTTSGRIVQLKGSQKDRSVLIPERAMQQRERTVGRGSLHVFPNGLVVALRRGSGTVEAFNSELGTRVGKWRLPNGMDWLMLCGGGDSLFVLGLRDRRHTEMHRFTLPAELKVGPVQALGPIGLSGRVNEI